MSTGDGASIEFDWGDGPHKFCLKLGEIRELQDKCKAGVMDIFARLRDWHWYVDDPREVIRLGLIGGGMGSTEALVLIARYVDGVPRMRNVLTAFKILSAAMAGMEEDQPGKATAEEPTMTTDGSASPSSTEPEPSSAGPQERSIN